MVFSRLFLHLLPYHLFRARALSFSGLIFIWNWWMVQTVYLCSSLAWFWGCYFGTKGKLFLRSINFNQLKQSALLRNGKTHPDPPLFCPASTSLTSCSSYFWTLNLPKPFIPDCVWALSTGDVNTDHLHLSQRSPMLSLLWNQSLSTVWDVGIEAVLCGNADKTSL